MGENAAARQHGAGGRGGEAVRAAHRALECLPVREAERRSERRLEAGDVGAQGFALGLAQAEEGEEAVAGRRPWLHRAAAVSALVVPLSARDEDRRRLHGRA
jgi:hypothetical protein